MISLHAVRLAQAGSESECVTQCKIAPEGDASVEQHCAACWTSQLAMVHPCISHWPTTRPTHIATEAMSVT
eukprot:1584322-Prymnesium_polylepis.1